jgi:AcrR family transcriptional regulator
MPRPRQVTDEQIVDATVAAIGKHGPAKLTLAHVAGEVGVTPAALVRRFGSKAALLAAVAEGAVGHADRSFDRARDATDGPLQAVREALVAFAGGITDRAVLANHMAMLQLDIADPGLRARAAEQLRTVVAHIVNLLEDARAIGDLGDTAVAALADTVYTAYTGALVTWAIAGEGTLQDWIRARIDAVIAPYRTSGHQAC